MAVLDPIADRDAVEWTAVNKDDALAFPCAWTRTLQEMVRDEL